MGGSLWILRAVASVVLAIVVFAGFGALLLVNNVSGKLFRAEFYTSIIVEQDTYNRIYDQVLLDQEFRDASRDLTGDAGLIGHEDLVLLLREVFPPEYLQAQVEDLFGNAASYFNADAETLELYVDLESRLERVGPALLGYIDRRIDEVPEESLGPPSCDRQRLEEVMALTIAGLRELGQGRLPRSLPSLQSISASCRMLFFEAIFDRLVNNGTLDPRLRQALQESADDIRQEVVQGNTRGVLKQVARPLVAPWVDAAIAQASRGLDQQGRLDLVQTFAEANEGVSEARLRADLEDVRDRTHRARRVGKLVALAMVIGGTVLMGLVHLPSVKDVLRWPGLTLLLTGAVYFILGKVMESWMAGWLEGLLQEGLRQAADIPPSAGRLAADLLAALGRGFAEGFADPALVLVGVGAALFGASFLAAAFRRYLPGQR